MAAQLNLQEVPAEAPPEEEEIATYAETSFGANVLALPLAILLIPVYRITFLPAFIFDFFVMQFHELGHATASWLEGRTAVPLFYGETVWSIHRSLPFTLFLGLVAGAGLAAGLRWRYYYVATLSALVIFAQFKLAHIGLPAEMVQIWSGVGGQFILSGIVIMAYFYELPRQLRWDFWRFPVLGVATYVFLDSYSVWTGIAHGKLRFPLGSMLQGSDDPGGDMDRLLGQYNLNTFTITDSYLHVARLLMVLIAAHYLFSVGRFLWQRLSKNP